MAIGMCSCGIPGWRDKVEELERSRDGWEADALNYAKSRGCQEEISDRYLKALKEIAHLTKWDGDSTAHPLDVEEVHRIATAAIKPTCGTCGGREKVSKYHICPLCDGEIVCCDWKVSLKATSGGWWVYSCGDCNDSFAEEDNSILIPCPDCGKEDEVMDRFYIVWREDGTTPIKMHNTLREAEEEAARLAERHIDVKFHILGSLRSCEARAELMWQEHSVTTAPMEVG